MRLRTPAPAILLQHPVPRSALATSSQRLSRALLLTTWATKPGSTSCLGSGPSSSSTLSPLSSSVLRSMALRAYGNHLFVAGRPIYQYRYALVGAQRASWAFKPALGPAWELLTRWELREPLRGTGPAAAVGFGITHEPQMPDALLAEQKRETAQASSWLPLWCACAKVCRTGTYRT